MNHQQMIKPMLVGLAVLVALSLAGVPAFGYALPLVALLCPLMMLVMMATMMSHGRTGSGDPDRPSTAPSHDGSDR